MTNVDIDSRYFIDYSRQIAKGTDSIVRKCIDRQTNKRYAVKTISKFRCQQIEQLRNEIQLLQELDHSHVLSIVDFYEDSNYLHLVSEYCKGGEVFAHMVNGKDTKVFPEKEAVSIVKQVLEAVSYLHGRNIVHRDLKLENILFKTKKKDQVTLIDFDLATKHDEEKDEPLTQECGSLYYVSPEVLAHKYGKSCDVWAIGIVTYILLFGRVPFFGESNEITLMKIRAQDVIFPNNTKVSHEAQDFIKFALQKDPSDRATIDKLCEHPWVCTFGSDTDTPEISQFKTKNTNTREQKTSILKRLTSKFFLRKEKKKDVPMKVMTSHTAHTEQLSHF